MKSVRAALLFICFTVFTTGVLAAGNGVKVPPFERVQLGNGAVVLLMERHDVPLIAFSAVLRGGAVSDPAGESGMASLLVGLLEKGSGTRDAVAFAETVASVGGQVETSASTESIAVSGSFLAHHHFTHMASGYRGTDNSYTKPHVDADAFDVVGSRG